MNEPRFDEHEEKRKRIFRRAWWKALIGSYLLGFALLIGLTVGIALLTDWNRRFVSPFVGAFGGAFVFNLIIANVWASRAVRREDLSLARQAVETFENAGENARRSLRHARFEVWHPSPETHVGWCWFGFGLFALMALLSVFVARSAPPLISKVFLFGALPFFLALCAFMLFSLRTPDFSADGRDVRAWHGLQLRRVWWEDVAALEIATTYNALGDLVLVMPTFKNASGQVLLRVNLAMWSPSARDDVVSFLRRVCAPTIEST